QDKTQLLEGKVDWRGRIATKDKHGGQGPSSLILGTFACENMASLVLGVTLVTYFNGVMHYDVADAATQVTNYSGTSYILTVLVAILADTYIGRFKAVLISCWIEFLGLGLLAFQAHYSKYKPPQNCNILDPTSTCEKVGGKNAAFLFIALYLVALGSAGIKSALPSHGADQFDENDKKEALQMSSFFNWLLLAVCIGGSISTTFIVWIQENKGWDWGFFVSTMAMFLGAIIFCVGLPWYRIFVIKGSSAITEIFQVYVAAIRNRNLQLPEDSADLYEIDEDNEAAIPAEFLPHTDTYKYKYRVQKSASDQDDSRVYALMEMKKSQVEN
ncbi:protein nrt1 ptr family 4.5, partial [Nicotiana attenuata]